MNDLLGECKNELTVWAEKGMEKAVTQFTRAPCKGTVFQRVRTPPGNFRSSR
jgi:hypothetical protein